jgi:hypothetical protein
MLNIHLICRRVRKIPKSDYQLRHIYLTICPSIQSLACNNSTPTRWIFIKFDALALFEKLSRKFNFHENLTSITGTLHTDKYTFLIIHVRVCRSVFLRMGNVSDKRCTENENTRFVYTGRFIMFSVITNIYNKKTKGPTLMELFTATRISMHSC